MFFSLYFSSLDDFVGEVVSFPLTSLLVREVRTVHYLHLTRVSF